MRNMHINEIIDQLKNILVIWKAKEDGLYLKDFDNEKEVAQFIETDPYFVKKVLEGKTIQGQTWKPNIFYKPIDDKYQYRYIVVYRDDWKSYSEKKRTNRINKLTN